MNKPLTIQIFLPHGEPRGIKIAEITNRTIQAVYIPRSKLKESKSRKEISNVGVYLLLGENEDQIKPIVYIGEAEDCYSRLIQHQNKKDFWTSIIVFCSKSGHFVKSHAKYLEWLLYEKANENKRFILKNTSKPSKPHVTESMEADLMDNFLTINMLSSTLGFPIFDLPAKQTKQNVFYCKTKNASGIGQYLEDGFLIIKGSLFSLSETKSISKHLSDKRQKLIKDKLLIKGINYYTLIEDVLIKSPSTSAGLILGMRINGWKTWKNKQRQTLDEVYRK